MLLQQQELWLLCCSAVEEEEDSCIDGWVGELCDQCAPGHNGPDCTPDQVADEEPCALGWQGEDSDQCAPGHSGEGCARDTPPQVKQLCELGLHDHDRDAQTPCELCPASTYRDMTSGPHDCVPCPDGLVSTPGSPSSAYCVSSHPHTADRTAAAKAKATSVIPVRDAGCLPGWQGEDCDKCALGHSGEDCTTDTLPSPADPPAAEEAGCLPGWQGEDCDHCGPGHSGDDCTPISAAGPKKPAEGTVAKFPNSSPVTRAGPPPPWDEYGYIITHYCQGRFGNQFDYMLGLIDTAQKTNRTLVMPPFTDYSAQESKGRYPYFWYFGEIFDLPHLQQSVKAIDLGEFVAHFADRWAAAGHVGFCSYPDNRPADWAEGGCMTEGVPKLQFWRNVGVADKFQRFEVLRSGSHRLIKKVNHPVLALDCSPGKYPAPAKLDPLTRLLRWAPSIDEEAEAFIAKHLRRPFVAMHVRQAFFPHCSRGEDGSAGTVHSSGQCDEWVERTSDDKRPYPIDSCHPGEIMMQHDVAAAIEAVGALGNPIFVASDHSLTGPLKFLTDLYEVKTLDGGLTDHNSGHLRPQVDLAILSKADHFIGHCPSSFSHIAARLATVGGHGLSYWGLPKSRPKH